MKLIIARLDEMNNSEKKRLGYYRYRQFVQRLGWNLPKCTEGAEWDEFDKANPFFILAIDASDEICGCARLLPTTGPYLLDGVFAHLCDSIPPKEKYTWEISRFAVSYPNIARAFFLKCLEFCHALGGLEVVGIVNRSMERYYTYIGVNFKRIGPVTPYEGEDLIPISLPVIQNKLSGYIDNDTAQRRIFLYIKSDIGQLRSIRPEFG